MTQRQQAAFALAVMFGGVLRGIGIVGAAVLILFVFAALRLEPKDRE